jgi:hypothetical protein
MYFSARITPFPIEASATSLAPLLCCSSQVLTNRLLHFQLSAALLNGEKRRDYVTSSLSLSKHSVEHVSA